MNCQRELLGQYLDNRLTSSQRIWVEKHLTNCSRCQQEFNQLQSIDELLRTCETPEPDMNFLQAVLNAIEAEPSPLELEMGRRRTLAKYLGWGSIAGTIGLLFGLLVLFRGYFGEVFWNGLLWVGGQAAVFTPAAEFLHGLASFEKLATIVLANFKDNQYIWPIITVIGLCIITLTRELVADVQKVFGYRS